MTAVGTVNREAIFISHATPENNAFARWLGAKLAAMGYEVWADVLRLRGGADWSRELEKALRERAVKMLVVCSPLSMNRDGVRNEIEIATQLSKQLGDPEFIIPLRLAPFEAHLRIAHLQYIDFSRSWANGLTELLELVTGNAHLPRRADRPMENWLGLQTNGATQLVEKSERLTSNWLRIRALPKMLYYCEPPSGFPLEQFQNRSLYTWPCVPFATGVITFERPNRDQLLSPSMPARLLHETALRGALRAGWDDLAISQHEVRRQFSDLGNQAFERAAQARGLKGYIASGGRLIWWPDIKTAPLNQIRFNWPEQKGRRQIIGMSGKREVHWHYAVNANIRTGPIRHVRISARLIFSENGLEPITDSKRMHRLRRSFAKSWRNPRWRDMLSAFLWWFSNGTDNIKLDVSDAQSIVLLLPSASFTAPVRVLHAGTPPPDEDDPDVEFDVDWDDDEEEPPTNGDYDRGVEKVVSGS